MKSTQKGSLPCLSLDGADHLLSDEDDARYVGDLISTWKIVMSTGFRIPQQMRTRQRSGRLPRLGATATRPRFVRVDTVL